MNWISVKDRLPEGDGDTDVLTYGHSEGIVIAAIGSPRMSTTMWTTHWMPLPDPPEVEDE